MLAWIVAAVVLAACWFAFFFVAALVDEDANHWNWPNDNGPGPVATLRMLALSGVAAAVPSALTWVLIRFVF